MFITSGNHWPQWPVEIAASNLKAPSGEQNWWKEAEWNVYLGCGNDESEGESATTANSLMLKAEYKGW